MLTYPEIVKKYGITSFRYVPTGNIRHVHIGTIAPSDWSRHEADAIFTAAGRTVSFPFGHEEDIPDEQTVFDAIRVSASKARNMLNPDVPQEIRNNQEARQEYLRSALFCQNKLAELLIGNSWQGYFPKWEELQDDLYGDE